MFFMNLTNMSFFVLKSSEKHGRNIPLDNKFSGSILPRNNPIIKACENRNRSSSV